MPQTNVILDWRATYQYDAPRQKPSAVAGTVSRVPTAGSWAANVATLTVPATTDYVGSVYPITVAGMTPAGYNGTFQGTIASATTITYPLGSTPGAGTVFGTVSYPGIIPIGISTTLPATAVPNKPQWTGTQMAVGSEEWLAAIEGEVKTPPPDKAAPSPIPPVAVAEDEEEHDEEEADEETEEDDDVPPPHRTPPRRRR